MTNDATRATATALPEINRRRFLLNTTLAGAAVAVAAPVAAAADPDPLLAAIADYRAGMENYSGREEFSSFEEEDAAIAETYGPPFKVLNNWEAPAATLAGARAALRLVIDEGMLYGGFTENMVVAALGFLDQQGGAQ